MQRLRNLWAELCCVFGHRLAGHHWKVGGFECDMTRIELCGCWKCGRRWTVGG